MLTANRPSFRVAPREDSDRKVANVMSALLAYCYDVSDGRNVIREAIDAWNGEEQKLRKLLKSARAELWHSYNRGTTRPLLTLIDKIDDELGDTNVE